MSKNKNRKNESENYGKNNAQTTAENKKGGENNAENKKRDTAKG